MERLGALLCYLLFASSSAYEVFESSESKIIYGGVDATLGEFPYVVTVQIENSPDNIFHACGGVILNEYYILTAATCPFTYFATGMRVFVGTVDCNWRGNGTWYYVESAIHHPEFDYFAQIYDSDIGLIKVSTPIVFDKNVQPISGFAAQDEPLVAGDRLTMLSFGPPSMDPEGVEPLKKMDNMVVWDHNECVQLYQSFGHTVHAGQFCARLDSASTFPLLGDYDLGSPFITSDGTEVGIVSVAMVKNPSFADHPYLYTRVSHYTNWIVENMV